MSDADLDVLDVEQIGVDVAPSENRAGSSAVLLVAVCVGMGLVFGGAFAIWFFVGNAWFGSSVPAFMEWLGLLALTGR